MSSRHNPNVCADDSSQSLATWIESTRARALSISILLVKFVMRPPLEIPHNASNDMGKSLFDPYESNPIGEVVLDHRIRAGSDPPP
jgi:hypothetical protein